ncbi:MAG: DUF2341 domain-containing protein [Candidatus Pacebacteria bacterium]|nr:DUF2341 domain-containing protein [Candidatus Paceibacterota bacterium]
MRKKKKKSLNRTVLIIICFAFAGLIVLELCGLLDKKVFAATLDGWNYRKLHSITGSTSGGQINYPIKITVNYGNGTDSNGVMYCNGNCNNDFGDIRFTGSDGTTLLDYWRESYITSSSAIFWVEVPSIPVAPEVVNIYIYYGNTAAITASNQLTTEIFSLKEHKSNASYYPNYSWQIASGKLRMDSTASSLGTGYMFTVVPRSWIDGKYIRWTWNGYYSSTLAKYFYLSIYDGEYSRSSSTDFPSGSPLITKGKGLLQRYYENEYGVWGPYTREILVNVSTGNQDFVTIFFHFADSWTAQTLYLSLDEMQINTSSGGVGNLLSIDFSKAVNMEVTGGYFDYGLYRGYISSEPVHGDWGPEESLDINISTYPIAEEGFYFGEVVVGESLTLNLEVINDGGISVSGNLILSSPFSCSSYCSYNVNPGESAFIPITFAPISEGQFYITGVLSVSGSSNIDIPLRGYGSTSSILCQDHDVKGYAWSDNMGWISFSCKNENVQVDYGVDIDDSDPEAEQWKLSGYAWSDNIGWITFYDTQLTGCPDGNCSAWIDTSVGNLHGWARACSVFENGCSGELKASGLGGWDGWIKFYDNMAKPAYVDDSVFPAEFMGYMWGDMNIGWISLNHENKEGLETHYAVEISIEAGDPPTIIFTKDPDGNDNYCDVGLDTGDISKGMVTFEWEYSDQENPETYFDIRISPVGDSSNYIVDETKDATCSDTEPPILCTNTWSAYISDTEGELEYGQSYNWEVQVHSTKAKSGWMQASGDIGTFTTASAPYPWVDFTWSPEVILINDITTFDSSLSISYGTSPSYFWQFTADAVPNNSYLQNPTTTFTIEGDKSVTLGITDSNGSCPKTKTITATLPLPDWIEIPPE